MTPTVMNKQNVPTVAKISKDPLRLLPKLQQWKKDLKMTVSAEGDSVIAQCKYIDVDADDLRKLADLIGNNWTVTFGRSGANFRMIIW
jgi:hypothetical protein